MDAGQLARAGPGSRRLRRQMRCRMPFFSRTAAEERAVEWPEVGQRTPSRHVLEVGKNNYLGKGAMVLGGEVAGMAGALEKGPRDRGVLILADSMAAIQVVKKQAERARTGELVRVMREVRRRRCQGYGVRFKHTWASRATRGLMNEPNSSPRW